VEFKVSLVHAASRLKDREIAVPSKRRMKQISSRDDET